jgi:hypothetical protein
MALAGTPQKAPETAIPPRNKGGRPLGSTNRNKNSGGFDYEKPKATTFTQSKDFQEFIAGYPNKHGLLGYLYRVYPAIDLSLIGNTENSIHKTASEVEMTEEWISSRFGRGRYQLRVIDSNRPGGHQEVAKTFFDCMNAEKLPQYDPRTLCLADPKNLDEVNRLLNAGILIRDPSMNGAPRINTSPPAAAAAMSYSDPFGRIDMGNLFMTLLDRGKKDPHETVQDVIAVAKQLTVPPPVDIEAIMERVVARLAPKQNPDLDALAVYERIDGFLNKIRPAAGSESSRRAPTGPAAWAPYISPILQEARALIPEIMLGLRELRAERAGAVQNGVHHMPQHTQPGQPNGAQRPQPRPAAPAEAPIVAGAPAEVVPLSKRIEEVVTLGFQRMREGMRGEDYANWVIGFYPGGREVFDFLVDAGCTDGVIALAASHPQGRLLVNDPETRQQITSFLDDFFGDPEAPAGEDESAVS